MYDFCKNLIGSWPSSISLDVNVITIGCFNQRYGYKLTMDWNLIVTLVNSQDVGDGFNPSTKPIEQRAQSSKPSRRRRRSRFSRLQLNQEAPLVEAESKRSEVDRLNGSKRASHNQARRTDKAQSVKRD